ncbi:hypothetical protein [Pedobacter terrae]|uniref:hypothetical protein n=1 Tax=Pedobacter terrae TaxID=405671 RepID=UPI002FFBFB52
MENEKHGLQDEPLGNEDQRKEDGPQSFEDKRPADLDIPKGDHIDTDTSRNAKDWKNQQEEND